MAKINNIFGSTSSFTPLSISDCKIWLDATDLTTITKDGADYVSAWADKSPSNYTFASGGATNQTKYFASGFGSENKPYLWGDGVSRYLAETGVVSMSNPHVFVAYEYDEATVTGVQALFTIGKQVATGKALMVYLRYLSGLNKVSLWDGGGSTFGSGITTQIPSLMEAYFYSDKSLEALVDGVVKATRTSTVAPNTHSSVNIFSGINTNYDMLGKISEVIVYDKQLTTDERNNVTNYLDAKYGLTI